MTTVLKEENGALTVQVPKAIVDELHLAAGSALDVFVEGDRIILQPRTATFSLEQLIGAEAPRQQEVELEQVVETVSASRG